MTWTIEAKRLPLDIFGATGHLYIEVWNDAGVRYKQLNGLATDASGAVRTIGSDSDFIKGYNNKILGDTKNFTKQDNGHAGVVLFSGTQADVLKALDYAASSMAYINAQNFHYTLTPSSDSELFNSNSVFNTFAHAMQKAVPISEQLITNAKNLGATNPGADKDIFQGNSWSPNLHDTGVNKGSVVQDTNNISHWLGTPGDDKYSGLSGNDDLTGGRGNDTLDGGVGNDNLDGGKDTDTYVFLSSANGKDTVTDSDKGIIQVGTTPVMGEFIRMANNPATTTVDESLWYKNSAGYIATHNGVNLEIWHTSWNKTTDLITITAPGNDAAIKTNWGIDLKNAAEAQAVCGTDRVGNTLNQRFTLTDGGQECSSQNNYVIIIDRSGSTTEELAGFKQADNDNKQPEAESKFQNAA